MKKMLLAVALAFSLVIAGLKFIPATPATNHDNESNESSLLRLELEAERQFLGPNYYIGDSFIVEGTIVDAEQEWLKIEQHLDSPPRPVEPIVNLHSHTVVQLRTVDSNHNLLSVDHYSVNSELLVPGTDVVILYLPDTEMAKSIMIYDYK